MDKLLVLKPFTTVDNHNNSLVLNGDLLYGEKFINGNGGYSLYSVETRQWLGRFYFSKSKKFEEYFEIKYDN